MDIFSLNNIFLPNHPNPATKPLHRLAHFSWCNSPYEDLSIFLVKKQTDRAKVETTHLFFQALFIIIRNPFIVVIGERHALMLIPLDRPSTG